MVKKIGLYIHIPFCVRKCNYCDFLSMPASEEVKKAYVDELIEEIKYKAMVFMDMEGSSDDPGAVESTYIGGGTPSILMPEDIRRIMRTIRQEYEIDNTAEISMEINPGTLEFENSDDELKNINNEGEPSFTYNGINKSDIMYRNEKIDAWKESGINRLSIGLQSADNKELQLLGRIHTYEEFLENYHFLREKGFNNINVDLMSALPYQSEVNWQSTLEKIASLKPEHISAYSLIIEENTPFFERFREDVAIREKGGKPRVLPDEDDEISMYERTGEILSEYGYKRYEISNYSQPGFECRHNIRYWKRGDYIGFGIGAASLFKDKRYKNISDIKDYLGLFTKEEYLHYKNLYEETILLDERSKMEEYMFLGFRMSEGIDLDDFEKEFPGAFERHYAATFSDLASRALLEEYKPGRWRLTDRGVNISNYVLSFMLIE